MSKRNLFAAITLAFSALALTGCNLYSSFDEPENDPEIVDKALTMMDEGKCADAVKLFQGKTGLDDDGYHTLGWAQLCANGASLTNVAKTMFSYSSDSNNLTIVGTLANALIPQNDTKIAGFSSAIASFSLIKNPDVRTVNLTMAYLVKVGAIIAKQAINDGSTGVVIRADIGACSSGCTVCGATANDLSAADAQSILDTITLASSVSNSGMGSVGALTKQLVALGVSGTTAIRCAVWDKFLSQ